MSTMAIDDRTYKAIEHALTSIKYSGNGCGYNLHAHLYGFLRWDRDGAKGYTKNAKEYEGVKRFVGVLRAQNNRAYHAAYMHNDDVKDYRTPKYSTISEYDTIPRKKEPLTPIVLLKTLQAVSYNLDNFRVPLLNRLISALQDQIISNLPEYNAAKWGEIS